MSDPSDFVGFSDHAAAREHVRARRAFLERHRQAVIDRQERLFARRFLKNFKVIKVAVQAYRHVEILASNGRVAVDAQACHDHGQQIGISEGGSLDENVHQSLQSPDARIQFLDLLIGALGHAESLLAENIGPDTAEFPYTHRSNGADQ